MALLLTEWWMWVEAIAALLLIGVALANIAWHAGGREEGRARQQAGMHFTKGSQLLVQARSATERSQSLALAQGAVEEAELALCLVPDDGASHVLKALALEQQGRLSDALQAMRSALRPPAFHTLSPSEKADAFTKRAGLLIAASKSPRRLDRAIADLQRSVELDPDKPKAHCILGLCYEKKGLFPQALASYQKAFGLDPYLDEAQAGLMRLRP